MPERSPHTPLREHVHAGIRRGGLVGVYFFALLWFPAVLGRAPAERVVLQPVTSGFAVIAGFAIAGALLLSIKHRVTSLGRAIACAVACSFPIWAGVLTAIKGLSIRGLGFACLMSAISGAIWGTMSWKGWHR